MKALFKLVLVSVFIFVLIACGGENESSANGANSNESSEDTGAQEEKEDEDKENSTMTKEENEKKDAEVGDTITSEAGEQTLVSRTEDIGTFESGPIKLTIKKVNGVSGTLKGDVREVVGQEQIEYIQVDMKVENTSEDDISFYASQAVLTTNTGEQLDPDMILSDHIDGEYLGQVKKKGSSFYILEDSKAKDVTSVTLHFDPAQNSDFERIGEKIEKEIELKK